MPGPNTRYRKRSLWEFFPVVITPAATACEIVDVTSPACEIVNVTSPACEIVDVTSPACEIVDVTSPACEIVDVTSPACEIVDVTTTADVTDVNPPKRKENVDNKHRIIGASPNHRHVLIQRREDGVAEWHDWNQDNPMIVHPAALTPMGWNNKTGVLSKHEVIWDSGETDVFLTSQICQELLDLYDYSADVVISAVEDPSLSSVVRQKQQYERSQSTKRKLPVRSSKRNAAAAANRQYSGKRPTKRDIFVSYYRIVETRENQGRLEVKIIWEKGDPPEWQWWPKDEPLITHPDQILDWNGEYGSTSLHLVKWRSGDEQWMWTREIDDVLLDEYDCTIVVDATSHRRKKSKRVVERDPQIIEVRADFIQMLIRGCNTWVDCDPDKPMVVYPEKILSWNPPRDGRPSEHNVLWESGKTGWMLTSEINNELVTAFTASCKRKEAKEAKEADRVYVKSIWNQWKKGQIMIVHPARMLEWVPSRKDGSLVSEIKPASYDIGDKQLVTCEYPVAWIQKTKETECEIRYRNRRDYHYCDVDALGADNKRMFALCLPGDGFQPVAPTSVPLIMSCLPAKSRRRRRADLN